MTEETLSPLVPLLLIVGAVVVMMVRQWRDRPSPLVWMTTASCEAGRHVLCSGRVIDNGRHRCRCWCHRANRPAGKPW